MSSRYRYLHRSFSGKLTLDVSEIQLGGASGFIEKLKASGVTVTEEQSESED